MILLVPLAFALCFLALPPVLVRDPRRGLLMAALVLYGLSVAVTELLGWATLLAPRPLVAYWWALACGLAVLTFVNGRAELRTRWQALARLATPQSPIEGAALGFVVVLMATIAVVAYFGAPNTPDVLVYHLPRVLHWLQNASLQHYPTCSIRQLEFPPGVEIGILHAYVLNGLDDRFVNFVQWPGFGLAIVGASLLAREIGATRGGQVLSGFVAATIPMAVMQASSGKNDIWVGVCLLAFVVFALELARCHKEERLAWGLACGLALGLAALSKTTAYFFGAGLVVWLAWRAIATMKRGAIAPLVLAGVVALALNAPHYQRNIALFGNPITANEMKHTRKALTPGAALSGIVSITALHLALPDWMPRTRALMTTWLVDTNSAVGIEVDDADHFLAMTTLQIPEWKLNESTAANSVHFLAILITLGLMAVPSVRRRLTPEASALLVAVVVGYCLFCVSVRWSPYRTRLHTPVFQLLAPVVVVVLVSVVRLRALVLLLVVLMTAHAVAAATLMVQRPLVGRWAVWRVERMASLLSYYPDDKRYRLIDMLRATSRLHPRTLALVTNEHMPHYAIWYWLRDEHPAIIQLQGRRSTRRLERVPPFSRQYPDLVFIFDRGDVTALFEKPEAKAEFVFRDGSSALVIPAPRGTFDEAK